MSRNKMIRLLVISNQPRKPLTPPGKAEPAPKESSKQDSAPNA